MSFHFLVKTISGLYAVCKSLACNMYCSSGEGVYGSFVVYMKGLVHFTPLIREVSLAQVYT